MLSSIHYNLLLFSFGVLFLFSVAEAQPEKPKPKALLFPIRKDTTTLQYYTTLKISSPGNNVKLVIDLAGEYTWFDCHGFKLPTYKPVECNSLYCNNTKSPHCVSCHQDPGNPNCLNKCYIYSYNPFFDQVYDEDIGEDALFVDSTNGLSVGLRYQSPTPFPFTCIKESSLLTNLSTQTKGILGLSKGANLLPIQMWTQFKLPYKFALCMPSTSRFMLGHMFIGGGPYLFPPYNKDIGKELITTPLVINPVSTAPLDHEGEASDEYFIDVKSICVDNKLVTVNTSLLSIDKKGNGGTKLSTIYPFTTLETSIYKALVSAFNKAAEVRKMKRVASVAPFGACFRSKYVAKSQTGPVVPYIDLGLAGGKQHWRFYGENSMVSVNKEVMCLAFVDAASDDFYPALTPSVVIGAHQMENYLIEFDLTSSKLGISSPLSFRNTTCSQSRVI